MENLWARFDNIANKEDIENAEAEFEPVEEGIYEMKLETIEAGENKSGLPMLKAKFRIVSNDRLVFFNHNIQVPNYDKLTHQNIVEAMRFISGILGETVEFEGFAKLGETIGNIPTGDTYMVEVSYQDSDVEQKYSKLKIVGDENPAEYDPNINDDLPF